MQKKHGYTREYKKEGVKMKLTLYFLPNNIKKLEKLRSKNVCKILSMASVIEEIVNAKLDRMKL